VVVLCLQQAIGNPCGINKHPTLRHTQPQGEIMKTARCFVLLATIFFGDAIDGVCQESARWAIAIHGGASGDPAKQDPKLNEARKRVLKAALQAGSTSLKNGKEAVSVVQEVIMRLEDAPEFNAGKGAVFNSEGQFELDSSIMDGRSKACGAVAGVSRIKNPIGAARLVMEKTRHVLLAGRGAERFVKSEGIKLVKSEYFWSERQRSRWDASQKQKPNGSKPSSNASGDSKGTVGCVVFDSKGNLAAGTSTGGLSFKMPGRIGDSPIIGAGTYADNATCAVSCTGTGEEYIRHAIAFHVSARMEYTKDSVSEAVHFVLTKKLKRGDGGIIAVDRNGQITMQNTTQGMARAAADSKGRFEVSLGGPQDDD
jgi:L-asparaginase / beta-aspartyl-peptidase